MRKDLLARAFFGVMIVALGGILLLQNLDIIKFNNWGIFWGIFWGSAFILAGLSAIFSKRPLWFWGILLIVIGLFIGLNLSDIIDVNFWSIFFPALIILVGASVIFNIKPSTSKKSGDDDSSDGEKTAIFYGQESRVKGNYEGGALTAIFGGVELDLRQAKIKDGSVISVFTFCGGITIMMPDDVVVKNEVRGVFGGSEDKSIAKSSAKKEVYIQGECILGGLEIK